MATLRRLRRREEQVPFLLLVPFIDILLVLICFILSVSFHQQFSLNVNLPESETGKMVVEKTFNIAVLSNGNILFQGQNSSIEGFPALLALSLKGLAQDVKPQVMLSGDEEIPYSKLIQVMDILRYQGLTDISLLTKNIGNR